MNPGDAVEAFFGHLDGEAGGYFTRDGAMPSGGEKEKRLGETAAALMKKYSESERSLTALKENETYSIEVDYNSSNDIISLEVYRSDQREDLFRSRIDEVNLHEWSRELEKVREEYGETERAEALV